jgi:SPASM domain peptide maturase of grasp-with-spasm system
MNLYKDKVFLLFSDCFVVKGVKRSIICDLQRNRYEIIPNSLAYILLRYEGFSVKEIKNREEEENALYIEQYFAFLIEKEFIFFCSRKEVNLFPKMEKTFDYPFEISHCIIDIDRKSKFDLNNIRNQMELINLRFCQIRLFNPFTFSEIVSFIKNIQYPLLNIELILQYDKSLGVSNIKKLLVKYNISHIIINDISCSIIEDLKTIAHLNITFIEKKIDNCNFCGNINSYNFTVNKNTFFESQNFNSCLNGKFSIATDGSIKNCPSMGFSFGNIYTSNLLNVLKLKKFKKLWNITKNKIDVCSKCEFRYICTDCRAYIENPKDIYSKPLKCGYNPSTGVWEEWSTNPLKKEAINFYNL